MQILLAALKLFICTILFILFWLGMKVFILLSWMCKDIRILYSSFYLVFRVIMNKMLKLLLTLKSNLNVISVKEPHLTQEEISRKTSSKQIELLAKRIEKSRKIARFELGVCPSCGSEKVKITHHLEILRKFKCKNCKETVEE